MESAPRTIWEHIEDLRRTLVRVLLVIFFSTALSFGFYQNILHVLTLPLQYVSEHSHDSWQITPFQIQRERISNTSNIPAYFQDNSVRIIGSHKAEKEGLGYRVLAGGHLDIERETPPGHLIVLGPIEGFRTALKASFWFGMVVSSPVWLWLLFQFVAPALHSQEKRAALPVICFCLFFLILGGAFGFLVTIPIANKFLFAFNGTIGLNLWSLSLYLDYTVLLLLANALAFEMSALLFIAVHYGIVTAQWLTDKRRVMCVIIFVIAMLLTPPDVFTQLLMAIPMLIIYEGVILYAKSRQKGLLWVNVN